MQLQFTKEEQRLLAEVLEGLSLRGEGPIKAKSYALLDRVIAHDFRMGADELEDLKTILSEYSKMTGQKAAGAQMMTNPGLQQRRQMLEKIRDKVTEACMMV